MSTRRTVLLLPLAGVLAAADLASGAAPRAAALAAERCVFPDDPAVLDVKRDFGAKADGIADDTAALQAAIAASSNRGADGGTKVLFLPNRVYRITSTLVVKAGVGPWVYGEFRGGAVIRLADDAPADVTAVLRTHPSDTNESSADFFMRSFRNVTIDVGSNPHADAVRCYGNNSGILKNVRVTGSGRVGIHSGFLGGDRGACGGECARGAAQRVSQRLDMVGRCGGACGRAFHRHGCQPACHQQHERVVCAAGHQPRLQASAGKHRTGRQCRRRRA